VTRHLAQIVMAATAVGSQMSEGRVGQATDSPTADPIAGELVQRLRRSSEFPAVSDPNDAHKPGLRKFNTFGVAATGRVLFSR